MALTDKLTAIANAIRGKTGGTKKLTLDEMVAAINSISGGGSSGPVIQYTPSVSRITNKTAYTAVGAAITVKESGNYKCYWMHYSAAASTSYYLTRLYVNGTAVGSTHGSPAYNGSSGWVVTESSIALSAGDTVQVYARTRSGTSYYTVAGMLVIEKI